MAEGISEILFKPFGGTEFLPLFSITGAFSCFIESKDLYLEAKGLTKFIQKILLTITNEHPDSKILVTLKFRKLHSDSLVSSDTLEVVSGRVQHRYKGAKLVRIRIEDTHVIQRWKISEIEFLGQPGGVRI